jgi:hypothetical protein
LYIHCGGFEQEQARIRSRLVTEYISVQASAENLGFSKDCRCVAVDSYYRIDRFVIAKGSVFLFLFPPLKNTHTSKKESAGKSNLSPHGHFDAFASLFLPRQFYAGYPRSSYMEVLYTTKERPISPWCRHYSFSENQYCRKCAPTALPYR